jgi:2-oxoglutarate ferredoxin oxidoreductase subunit alpha
VTTETETHKDVEIQELERVTIRFAGDSGDGMQLTGSQFTRTAAVFGNDISTLPDFPAEIRAPAGSLPGVSGFQISFSSAEIYTPGDAPDVLVAMNPAALRTNIGELPRGGALILNSDAFTANNLKKAGYAFGETTEMFHTTYRVAPAKLAPGTYRNITGNEATALGFVVASKLAQRELVYGSYPITPASDILHQLAGYKNFGVKTFQAEDEIAAIGSAIGAAYGGALALTASSGPGIALKSEAMNLAVMVELPLVVVDVQRAGPSTGMPTKTEQTDLLMAMFGRNGESPVPIVAPATPAECFDYAIEAARLALKYMTPVMYLSDGFLANGSEPWRLPNLDQLADMSVPNHTDKATFQPYNRDPDTLARPWAVPGTPGLEHRIGGLEKADVTGNVSYDPENHHKMTELRAAKIAGIADDIPPLSVFGKETGDVLVVGWGSTYGAIRSAVERLQAEGWAVSHVHLRHLNPLPQNTEQVLRGFKHVLVPEVNMGQLSLLLRAKYLIDVKGLNKVRGKPYRIIEIKQAVEELLK